jgi:hypothetical protein
MRAQQLGPVLVVLVATLAIAAGNPDAVKSGPQVGARIRQPFEVKCCNGPDAGDMACLV